MRLRQAAQMLRLCPISARPRTASRLLSALAALWSLPATAQQVDQSFLFDPTRLSVQETFGYQAKTVPNSPAAAAPARAVTSETEIAYMMTNLYRLAIAVPVSLNGMTNNPFGATKDKFSWNGVAVRNLFIQPIAGTGGSFVALGVDFGYAPLGAAFPASPGSRFSASLTPIVGFHHDAYDLILSSAITFGLGAGPVPAVAPAVRLTRRIAEDFALGVEYDGGLGQFGRVALRDQSHLVFGIADFKLSGFDLSLGVGYGLTPASNGVAAKLGVGHGF